MLLKMHAAAAAHLAGDMFVPEGFIPLECEANLCLASPHTVQIPPFARRLLSTPHAPLHTCWAEPLFSAARDFFNPYPRENRLFVVGHTHLFFGPRFGG